MNLEEVELFQNELGIYSRGIWKSKRFNASPTEIITLMVLYHIHLEI